MTRVAGTTCGPGGEAARGRPSTTAGRSAPAVPTASCRCATGTTRCPGHPRIRSAVSSVPRLSEATLAGSSPSPPCYTERQVVSPTKSPVCSARRSVGTGFANCRQQHRFWPHSRGTMVMVQTSLATIRLGKPCASFPLTERDVPRCPPCPAAVVRRESRGAWGRPSRGTNGTKWNIMDTVGEFPPGPVRRESGKDTALMEIGKPWLPTPRPNSPTVSNATHAPTILRLALRDAPLAAARLCPDAGGPQSRADDGGPGR
jgi:hypothetical protein